MAGELFFSRSRPFNQLDALWHNQHGVLVVLTGHAQVGKTRLMLEWGNRQQRPLLYWQAQPNSPARQLASFGAAIEKFVSQQPLFLSSNPVSWEMAFAQVGALSADNRLVCILDNFDTLLDTNTNIVEQLANVWQQQLHTQQVMFVLAGSNIRRMRQALLGAESSLKRHITAHLQLEELSFAALQNTFPQLAIAEQVALYSMTGGQPKLWRPFSNITSLSDLLRHQLIAFNRVLRTATEKLVSDNIRNPHNYTSVLQAIAFGHEKQSEIIRFCDLDQGHVSRYLSLLTQTGLIRRESPLTRAEFANRSRSVIVSPFLQFYLRFLADEQTHLAQGCCELVLQTLRDELQGYVERTAWPSICRAWLVQAAGSNELGLFSAETIGRTWNGTTMIPVVGINLTERTLLVGTCIWGTESADIVPLQQLVADIPKISPHLPTHWRVQLLGFSRSGWTPAAHDWANEHSAKGQLWQSVGCHLFDLNDVAGL